MNISKTQQLLVTIAVMSAAFMQVLDTTIVNVALPHMRSSLGATPDQISWALTCYLVASGICMPLTGYFSDRLGRKNYLLWCIGGFVVASALCGTSQSLTEIILYRVLQGIFGAGLVPLSQTILIDTFPPKALGKAMAIWGAGIMLGPILGPTLGGYLTEVSSWRWTFYVNVPMGIAAFLLAWNVISETPKKDRRMDWLGLVLLFLGVGGTQYFLDRGNREDWFSATNIKIAATLAFIGLTGFIVRELKHQKKAFFDIRIFKNRNFAVSSIILLMLGLGLFGTMVIQPMFLEEQLGYPVLTTGLAISPRGLASMVSMILVSKLIARFDPRLLIAVGTILGAIGMWIGTFYSLDVSMSWIIWPSLLQGLGIGLIFAPLTAVAFATLPETAKTEAAGLFSLIRTMGSSIGIAIILTLFSRHSQTAWNHLSGFINPYNPIYINYLATLHLSITDPKAIQLVASEVGRQAQMLAFINVFTFIAWNFLTTLPLLLLLKKSVRKS
ncbi:MAG: DHA2 family efflux MFS transporter permease subunit [Gammaproteobacteria bacterium]